MKKLFFLLVAGVLLSCLGESTETLTPLPPKFGSGGTGTAVSDSAATIDLVIGSSEVLFGASTNVKATVRTSDGKLVPDGTVINFTVANPVLGTVSPQATTFGGTSTALFTAGKITAGSTTITATFGSVSTSTPIKTIRPDAGSIEFVSAKPNIIGIRGSGKPETAFITFSVKDVLGDPIVDGTSVDFTMSGPNGGEYIGTSTAKPKEAKSATKGGIVTVALNSGLVAGPVNMTASVTVNGKTFSTSAPPVSIGGGVPSATHFDLATTRLNLPGLVFVNSQAEIKAFIADRFGNFNVLEGTALSFHTEAGAIGSGTSNTGNTAITDIQGFAKATLRTQAPMPVDVVGGNGHPEDGRVTVLAVTVGEEAFDDVNGNGKYDAGGPSGNPPPEPFTDLPEPFVDSDEDRQRDPNEVFIDADGKGSYTDGNGVWDGPGCTQPSCLSSKMIWATIRLVFTGQPICTLTPSDDFTVDNASKIPFTLRVGDINNNPPTPGTTIAVAATAGTLSTFPTLTLADMVGTDPFPLSKVFSLSDNNPTASSTPVTVTLTVTPSDGVPMCIVTSSGVIR